MKYLFNYAYEYEDVIIYHMLRNVSEKICWIDVGANDPVDASVTKMFSDMDGRGINIEPQRYLVDRLIADRPNDVNLEVGISNKEGELLLYGVGTGATFDKDNDRARYVKGAQVPVLTLKQVCDQHNGIFKNGNIHFLKIDVEGWEKEVLEGMDFQNYRPWIVCVEFLEGDTVTPSWEHILLDNSYVFAGTHSINRYYVSNEHKELAELCCSAEELKRHYKIFNYWLIKTTYEKTVEKQKKRDKILKYIFKLYGSRIASPIRVVYRAIKRFIITKKEICN